MGAGTMKRVSELARETGLTVRALHHYEAIGLLSPSGRSPAGYRLYSGDDVARLQRIVSLRQLGFPLREIGECLDRPDFSLRRVLELHLARLEERIDEEHRLRDRLRAILASLRASRKVSVEALLGLTKETVMYQKIFEKYYTPEQLKKLAEGSRRLGEKGLRKGEADWARLLADVRTELDKGTAPDSPAGRRLVKRWDALVRQFTCGDAGIEKSLRTMYEKEPPGSFGVDPAVAKFIAEARAADGPQG